MQFTRALFAVVGSVVVSTVGLADLPAGPPWAMIGIEEGTETEEGQGSADLPGGGSWVLPTATADLTSPDYPNAPSAWATLTEHEALVRATSGSARITGAKAVMHFRLERQQGWQGDDVDAELLRSADVVGAYQGIHPECESQFDVRWSIVRDRQGEGTTTVGDWASWLQEDYETKWKPSGETAETPEQHFSEEQLAGEEGDEFYLSVHIGPPGGELRATAPVGEGEWAQVHLEVEAYMRVRYP